MKADLVRFINVIDMSQMGKKSRCLTLKINISLIKFSMLFDHYGKYPKRKKTMSDFDIEKCKYTFLFL